MAAGSQPTGTSHPDLCHLDLLRGISFQPVFIMGDHRSGTTLLYQLLDTTGCFNVVRAYHIVHHDALLTHHADGTEASARETLTAHLRGQGQQNRMIDGVPVSADLPEEYGFLLDDTSRPRMTPENLESFRLFFRKIQYVSDPERPLLLKNPWDYSNFDFVKKGFPSARFVFVHRDPVHVVSSQIKASRTLMEKRSPYHAMLSSWYRELLAHRWRLALTRAVYSSRLRLGYHISCRHVRRATRHFLAHIHGIPPEDVVEIRYEDLCQDAAGTVRKILDFLGLQDRSGVDHQARIQPRPVALCPEVEQGQAAIRRQTRPYCAYCGYDVEEG